LARDQRLKFTLIKVVLACGSDGNCHPAVMNVSVLGLGIIGSAWAKNLIADGHRVRCWNRSPRDFPDFTPSIQDAVNGAEVIFIIVYDPPAVQSILNQILSKLVPGQLVIQSSTISAKWTRLFAGEVQKNGRVVSGGPIYGEQDRSGNSARLFIIWAAPLR